jgi:hypothetical protein
MAMEELVNRPIASSFCGRTAPVMNPIARIELMARRARHHE